jgi:hypothetical protein
LLLRRRAEGVLDASPVEAVNRLELVERDDDVALPLGGQPAGDGKDFHGKPVDVAIRADRRKGDRKLSEARVLWFITNLRPRRPDGFHQPLPGAIPARLDGGQCPGVAFEKGEV